MPRVPKSTASLHALGLLACLFAAGCDADSVGDRESALAVPAPGPASEVSVTPAPTTPVTPSDALPLAADGMAVLAAGQSVALDARTRLRFERVTEDSRCPDGAQCAWAGQVGIAMELVRGDARERFELSTHSMDSARLSGWRFELLDYAACPSGQGECAALRIVPEPSSTP